MGTVSAHEGKGDYVQCQHMLARRFFSVLAQMRDQNWPRHRPVASLSKCAASLSMADKAAEQQMHLIQRFLAVAQGARAPGPY